MSSSLSSLETYKSKLKESISLGQSARESSESLASVLATVDKLQRHEPPSLPELPALDGDVVDGGQVFRPQQANVAHNLESERAAVAIMRGMHRDSPEALDFFRAKVQSSSVTLLSVVAEQYVRRERDGDALLDVVMSLPPKPRRLLQKFCVRLRHNSALLDSLYRRVTEKHGVDVGDRFLHACTQPFVATVLLDEAAEERDVPHRKTSEAAESERPAVDERLQLSQRKEIQWQRIARFHGPTYMTLLERELSCTQPMRRLEGWSCFKHVATAARTGGQRDRLVALAIDYPTLTRSCYTTSDVNMPPRNELDVQLPPVVFGLMPGLLHSHADELVDFMASNVQLNAFDVVIGARHFSTVIAHLRHSEFARTMRLLSAIMEVSTARSFYGQQRSGSDDRRQLLQLATAAMSYRSCASDDSVAQWRELFDRLLHFYADKHAVKASWFERMTPTSLVSLYGRSSALYADYCSCVHTLYERFMQLAAGSRVQRRVADDDGGDDKRHRRLEARCRANCGEFLASTLTSFRRKFLGAVLPDTLRATRKHVTGDEASWLQYRRQRYGRLVLSSTLVDSLRAARVPWPLVAECADALMAAAGSVGYTAADVYTSSALGSGAQLWSAYARDGRPYLRELFTRHRFEPTLALLESRSLAEHIEQLWQLVGAAEALPAQIAQVLSIVANDIDVLMVKAAHRFEWTHGLLRTLLLWKLRINQTTSKSSKSSKEKAKREKNDDNDEPIFAANWPPSVGANSLPYAGNTQSWADDGYAAVSSSNVTAIGSQLSFGGGDDDDDGTLARISESAGALFDALLARCLAEGALVESYRDTLLYLQDIADKEVYKALTKRANSNNAAERQAAFATLIACALLPGQASAELLKRAVRLVRNKIKNDSAENRLAALHTVTAALPFGADSPAFAIDVMPMWIDMLKHTLESPEVASAPHETASQQLLNVFTELSTRCLAAFGPPAIAVGQSSSSSAAAAVAAAAVDTSHQWDFAIELQWRIAVFRDGERRAARSFVIDFPYRFDWLSVQWTACPYGAKHREPIVDDMCRFVDATLDAYDRRFGEKNAAWRDEPDGAEPIFARLMNVCSVHWPHVPALVGYVRSRLALMKEAADGKCDDEGLLLVESGCAHMLFVHARFESIASVDRFGWRSDVGDDARALFDDYLDTIIRSRQACRVLWAWLERGLGERLFDRAENRDAIERAIVALLDITKSAIHLRFVWAFLLRERQDLLAEFIGAQSAFRGVFYVAPDKRGDKLPKGYVNVKRAWQERLLPAHPPLADVLADERKAEQSMLDDVAPMRFADHEDFFCLPAGYQLHRLPAEQLDALRDQLKAIWLNPDRGSVERNKACARMTTLPNVDYGDIVQMYADYCAARQLEGGEAEGAAAELEAGAGESTIPVPPVPVVETLLRGLMYTDEPTAPLQFLLSPSFLGTDLARVAIYAIGSCVGYLESPEMTRLLLCVLTGKRRNALKVTAYKEVIRLLVARPTRKHMAMVLHEWDRNALHRDVRIAIVQAAFDFLAKDAYGGDEFGWRVLESAPYFDCPELHAALAAAQPNVASSVSAFAGKIEDTVAGFVQQPRLLEHLQALRRCAVPSASAARYATNVLLKLCDPAAAESSSSSSSASTTSAELNANAPATINDDVRFVCLVALRFYAHADDALLARIVELYVREVCDFAPEKLVNDDPTLVLIAKRRWQFAWSTLIVLACFTGRAAHFSNESDARKIASVALFEAAYAAYAEAAGDAELRVAIVARIEYALAILPSMAPPLSAPFELRLASVLGQGVLGTHFWRAARKRQFDSIDVNAPSAAADAASACLSVLRESATTPSRVHECIKLTSDLLNLFAVSTVASASARALAAALAPLIGAYLDADDASVPKTTLFTCIRAQLRRHESVLAELLGGRYVDFVVAVGRQTSSCDCPPPLLADDLARLIVSACIEPTPASARVAIPKHGRRLLAALYDTFGARDLPTRRWLLRNVTAPVLAALPCVQKVDRTFLCKFVRDEAALAAAGDVGAVQPAKLLQIVECHLYVSQMGRERAMPADARRFFEDLVVHNFGVDGGAQLAFVRVNLVLPMFASPEGALQLAVALPHLVGTLLEECIASDALNPPLPAFGESATNAAIAAVQSLTCPSSRSASIAERRRYTEATGALLLALLDVREPLASVDPLPSLLDAASRHRKMTKSSSTAAASSAPLAMSSELVGERRSAPVVARARFVCGVDHVRSEGYAARFVTTHRDGGRLVREMMALAVADPRLYEKLHDTATDVETTTSIGRDVRAEAHQVLRMSHAYLREDLAAAESDDVERIESPLLQQIGLARLCSAGKLLHIAKMWAVDVFCTLHQRRKKPIPDAERAASDSRRYTHAMHEELVPVHDELLGSSDLFVVFRLQQIARKE
jgi:hypothetical protein